MKRSPTLIALPLWARLMMVLGMVFAVGLTLVGVGGAMRLGPSPSPPPAAPSFDALPPLKALLALPVAKRFDEGETIRDHLVALPRTATPALLQATRHFLAHPTPGVVDVLLLALTDRGDPAAWPVYVAALDDKEEYVRFVAACGLDAAAGDQFKVVEKCIQGGHIDHAAIDARIPAMKKWWRQHGASHQATAAAAYTPPRRASPREQHWNFIALNPTWVMEAGGPVYQPTPGTRLPKVPGGVHVVGGTIREHGRLEDQEAAFELDAQTGQIHAVFVKGQDGWRAVPEPWTQAKPRFGV